MANHFWASGRKAAPTGSSTDPGRGTFYPHQQQSYPNSAPPQNNQQQYQQYSSSGSDYQPQQINPYAQNAQSYPSNSRATSPNPNPYYQPQRGGNSNQSNTESPRGMYYPHQQQATHPQQNYQQSNPYQQYQNNTHQQPPPQQQSQQRYPNQQYRSPEPNQSYQNNRNGSTSVSPTSSNVAIQQQPNQVEPNKTSFWNRFKSQVSLTSTSLGLSKEHDGDTEDDTLIAHSLVKFYTENSASPSGGEIPAWLNDTKAARHYMSKNHNGSVSSTDSYATASSGTNQPNYQSPQLNQYYAQRQSNGRQKSNAGASTLQEIYRKNSVAASSSNPMAAPQGSYLRPPVQPVNAPANGNNNNSRPSWVNNITGPSKAQQQQNYQTVHTSNSPTAQKMRDRLKSARTSADSDGDTYNAGGSAAGASWRNKATW